MKTLFAGAILLAVLVLGSSTPAQTTTSTASCNNLGNGMTSCTSTSPTGKVVTTNCYGDDQTRNCTSSVLYDPAGTTTTGSTTATASCITDNGGTTCAVMSPGGKYTSTRCTGSPQNPTCVATVIYDPDTAGSNLSQSYAAAGAGIGTAAGTLIGIAVRHHRAKEAAKLRKAQAAAAKFCNAQPSGTYRFADGTVKDCGVILYGSN
jgi:hypothetical protein